MNELIGRRVMKKEMTKDISLEGVHVTAAMKITNKKVQCMRCGSKMDKAKVKLATDKYYCPVCIQLGRIDSTEQLYSLGEPKSGSRRVNFCWQGKLTAGQKKISDFLVQAVERKKPSMVWAVTGAGKTEMLFQALHFALEKGYRVAVTSPRVDVCLELYPRIQEVFPNEKIALLHGEMEEAYRYTKLILATTHQLLRFHQAFDVLIIDEVDAFPYVNNEMLYQAAKTSLKKESTLIYLTATPTKTLHKETERGKLSTMILPARYHRRPLPVPKTKWSSQWRRRIIKNRLPKGLLVLIKRLLKDNDLLVFCPSISLMEKLYLLLKDKSEVPLTLVHSQDQDRLNKVTQMRNKKFRLLLTSTILERGVTFESVSVIVLGADHPIFSTAALVQISGRVDRKLKDRHGEVWFLHEGKTRAMKESIRQIKKMNKLAMKDGLIDGLSVLQ